MNGFTHGDLRFEVLDEGPRDGDAAEDLVTLGIPTAHARAYAARLPRRLPNAPPAPD